VEQINSPQSLNAPKSLLSLHLFIVHVSNIEVGLKDTGANRVQPVRTKKEILKRVQTMFSLRSAQEMLVSPQSWGFLPTELLQ
jgi:hypothetical protein